MEVGVEVSWRWLLRYRGDGVQQRPCVFSGSPTHHLGSLCCRRCCITNVVLILGVFHGEMMIPVAECKPQDQGAVTEETFFSCIFY